MAVQAQYIAAALPHDHGHRHLPPLFRSVEATTTHALLNASSAGAFKNRADDHLGLPPPPAMDSFFGDGGCGAGGGASTSGRPAAGGFLGREGAEIDAIIRAQSERLRVGLELSRRRHMQAILAVAERVLQRRVGEADAALALVQGRNAELEEHVRQLAMERDAWRDVARQHEAAAATLRANLEIVLSSAGAGPSRNDAADDMEATGSCGGGDHARRCKVCNAMVAVVLVLPCRHLCLCEVCEPEVATCPVCYAVKNAALRVSFA